MTAVKERDIVRWSAEVDVDKWDADQTRWLIEQSGLARPIAATFEEFGLEPVERIHLPAPANRLVTVGLARLTGQLTTNTQVWDNTHVGLAVGNSATADAIGDSDLGGASKRYNAMDATFPTVSNGVITFKATYASGEAEFAWDEYGVVVPNTTTAFAAGAAKPASYVLLNRKAPAALGTKGAGTSWALTVTITIV
jgi:hypothetical protein